MPEVLTINGTERLVVEAPRQHLTAEREVFKILEVARQGPPGASWPEPFALAARFGEIAADPAAKAQARANLDLQDIDCGTFN